MSSVPTTAKLEKDLRDAEVPVDLNIPDNYVDHTLKNTKPLPPVNWGNWWKELNYLSLAILTVTPSIALYGAFTTKLRWETTIFAVFYYFVTGLGERLHLSNFPFLPNHHSSVLSAN
jgi:stearoyl-CoA desaturase (delta-9 desaturase)